MGFKLNNPPYKWPVPIYHVDMIPKVIDHEMVHIDQMKRGDLDYDNDNVYWKGKTYSRKNMDEGNSALPWENEAYKNS